MNQTKLESIIEVFFNYLSGFVIAYFVYELIVIPAPWIKESALYVTTLFTLVSVVRTYLWRRFFNAGLHRTIHNITPKIEFVFKRMLCRFRGHDFGAAVYISPAMLTCCRYCGEEVQGRTIDDLEPMTDDDRDVLEMLEDLE